jgi:antitoxin (DNA-binding transcriptional repressor) of toxin-antitoxin stability system
MDTINVHEAKTHLSRLIDKAVKGEPFVIAKPMVKVTALDALSARERRRIGFMTGELKVPNDFDRIGDEEIAALFGGGS